MNKIALLVTSILFLQVAFAQQKSQKQLFPEHNSTLNIPFTHSSYAELDYYYNKGENSHTTSKPYLYNDAARYVNLDALKTPLLKSKTSWAGKKLWNEHLVLIQEEDFWFTINPAFDLHS